MGVLDLDRWLVGDMRADICELICERERGSYRMMKRDRLSRQNAPMAIFPSLALREQQFSQSARSFPRPTPNNHTLAPH